MSVSALFWHEMCEIYGFFNVCVMSMMSMSSAYNIMFQLLITALKMLNVKLNDDC